MKTVSILIAIAMCAASTSGGSAQSSDGQESPAAGKPLTVLFMCPHAAAKSVLASAYFTRLAKERGLNVHVESAGTDPDAEVAPVVAAHLERHGYPVPDARPRRATPGDLASADVVISIGCDLSGLPQPAGRLLRWDEIPAPSESFALADDAIRRRVHDLIEELLRPEAAGKR